MKLLILIIFFDISLFAFESAESFVVTIRPSYVHVLSPIKGDKKIQLVIVNKTLSDITSRLSYEDGTLLRSIPTVKHKKSRSISVDLDPHKKVFFMMLSPAFQAVMLDRGRKSYRIPPERKPNE